MKKEKDNNINYTHILGCDIETSTVPVDSFNPSISEIFEIKNKFENEIIEKYNGQVSEKKLNKEVEAKYQKYVRDMNRDIQVPFLTNTREINIKTGKFTNSTFHRTIRDWINYLNEISSENNIRIVYVQNLYYEMTFIRREMNASFIEKDNEVNDYGFNEVNAIMRNQTDVLYAILDCCPNIIFRDSLAIFNKTLKKMGEDLNDRLKKSYEDGEIEELVQYPKLEYDYKKVRLPWDELKQLDYDYNERDNDIVLLSLYYYLKDYNFDMENVPLTSTAETKIARKRMIVERHSKNHLRTLNFNKSMSLNDYDSYEIFRNTYQGGLTGGNFRYINKMVQNVYSIDIKSSYPYQMIHNVFPYYSKESSKFLYGRQATEFYIKNIHGLTRRQLTLDKDYKEVDVKGFYIIAEFTDVVIKDESSLLELSYSHCIGFEPDDPENILVNGKIKVAKKVTVYFNDVDLERFNSLYDYEGMEILTLVYTTQFKRLQEGETNFILSKFDTKESIDKKSNPIEYLIAKVHLNSMYGVKVQNPVRDYTVMYNGEIQSIKFDKVGTREGDLYDLLNLSQKEVYENVIKKVEGKNGKEGGNFDIYSDGVYITSYARKQLTDMMITLQENGFEVIYADTDSLKFIYKKDPCAPHAKVSDMVKTLIDNVNESIINSNRKNVRMQEYYKEYLKYDESVNDDEKVRRFEKILQLGTWDVETAYKNKSGQLIYSPYPYFKTLGAKKYAYIQCDYDRENDSVSHSVHTTIAGCNKSMLPKAIENYSIKNDISFEESLDLIFAPGVLYDESVSGRTVAEPEVRSYEDCMKLTYNGRKLNSGGGVIVRDSTYLLNITENDSVVTKNFRPENAVLKLNIKGELVKC